MTDDECVNAVKEAVYSTAWVTPIFVCLSSVLKIRVSEKTKTMSVDMSGNVLVNKAFAQSLLPRELEAVAAHECSHLILDHVRRGTSIVNSGEGESFQMWNVAADIVINEMLADLGFMLPHGVLRARDASEKSMSVDELYELLREDGHRGGDGECMRGCGVSGDATTASDEVARAIEQSLYAGSTGGQIDTLNRVFAPPPPRAALEKVINRYASMAEDSRNNADRTFSRRSRRSYGTDIFLPGQQGETASVILLVDTSGSMCERMLNAAIESCVAVQEIVNVSVTVALHDFSVYRVEKRAQDVCASLMTIQVGGTSFVNAYSDIESIKQRFDVMIHLTDGYAKWPTGKPRNVRKVVAAFTGTEDSSPDWADGILVDV